MDLNFVYRRLIELIGEPDTWPIHMKSQSVGFMDLNFDRLDHLNNGRLRVFALSHYYKHESGDMVPDPDMQILVNVDKRTACAMTFEMLGIYHEVFPAYPDVTKARLNLQQQLNEFLLQWLDNLKAQEHTFGDRTIDEPER